jgi:hypothetical protein
MYGEGGRGMHIYRPNDPFGEGVMCGLHWRERERERERWKDGETERTKGREAR